MKLSNIKNEKTKKKQIDDIDISDTVGIMDVLEKAGLPEDVLVNTAMELYVPHPGVETKEIAEDVFKRN